MKNKISISQIISLSPPLKSGKLFEYIDCFLVYKKIHLNFHFFPFRIPLCTIMFSRFINDKRLFEIFPIFIACSLYKFYDARGCFVELQLHIFRFQQKRNLKGKKKKEHTVRKYIGCVYSGCYGK